jgi:Zn finger protein HypA/HybF involved in hydrogenase expression
MADELEAILWCPRCAAERARVYRKRTSSEDVFTHEVVPAEVNKTCPECDANLERNNG